MNSNVSRPVPPANTGSKFLDILADTLLALVHLERRFDPVLPSGVRCRAARSARALRHRADQRAARRREARDRRRAAAAGRGRVSRLDHRQLREADARCCGSRAASSAAATPRRTASSAASSSCTTICPPQFRHGIYAEPQTYPGVGPLLRAGPLHHAGHRRRRLHEHQHQADGRARAEADGRGEVHAGHVRRLARRPS